MRRALAPPLLHPRTLLAWPAWHRRSMTTRPRTRRKMRSRRSTRSTGRSTNARTPTMRIESSSYVVVYVARGLRACFVWPCETCVCLLSVNNTKFLRSWPRPRAVPLRFLPVAIPCAVCGLHRAVWGATGPHGVSHTQHRLQIEGERCAPQLRRESRWCSPQHTTRCSSLYCRVRAGHNGEQNTITELSHKSTHEGTVRAHAHSTRSPWFTSLRWTRHVQETWPASGWACHGSTSAGLCRPWTQRVAQR